MNVGGNVFEISYVKKGNVHRRDFFCLLGENKCMKEGKKYKISICILWNCRVCANCSVETGDTLTTNFNLLA